MHHVALLLAVGGFPSTAPNMNGAYVLSETPQGSGANEKFPLSYKDYPRGVEYFDVYSPPITTLYSQVFWRATDPVAIPEEIKAKYAGKGMAVVGFEADQVHVYENGTEARVPITVAYNHHFEVTMTGAKSRVKRVKYDGPHDPRKQAHPRAHMGHGIPDDYYEVEDLAPGNALPTSQHFGGANGGEYRKSFHGSAPGYARVIESPDTVTFTPMQIDTWNRAAMNNTYPTKFVAGPQPRNSLARGPGAAHSGLLECPVTTRLSRVVDGTYKTAERGACEHTIPTAASCFAAGPKVLGGTGTKFTTRTVANASLAPGCTASVASRGASDSVILTYNSEMSSTAACADGGASLLAGTTQSLVRMNVTLDVAADVATLVLSGPSDVWFGAGFGAQAMKDAPWAVICEATGNVTERKLMDQDPGKVLAGSLKVVSNTVANGVRTVVATRALKGAGADYYTFDPATAAVLPVINAVGSTPTISYHKAKTPAHLSLLPVAAAGVCVCEAADMPFGHAKGTLAYTPTSQPADVGAGSVGWGNSCPAAPMGSLLAQGNPTCDLRTYVGGQIACHHMWSLLDADQDIPWADQPIEYHLKFRFWVQPYNESYHTNLQHDVWGIASPVEYDVPKCNATTPGCELRADGTWVHTISGTFTGSGRLAAAHMHCHAPTCLSMALYRCPASVGTDGCNAATGELLCRENAIYGAGTAAAFEEAGFIAQPPCMWGGEEFGLEEPPTVDGYILHSVKTANATEGHHGEMAWQQVLLF